MSDESKLRDQADRGERANIVMRELEEAFKALEQDCYDTFRSSDLHDERGHKACRLYLKVMDDVKQRFMRAAIDGEVARKELVKIKPESRLRKVMNG